MEVKRAVLLDWGLNRDRGLRTDRALLRTDETAGFVERTGSVELPVCDEVQELIPVRKFFLILLGRVGFAAKKQAQDRQRFLIESTTIESPINSGVRHVGLSCRRKACGSLKLNVRIHRTACFGPKSVTDHSAVRRFAVKTLHRSSYFVFFLYDPLTNIAFTSF
jgi:hypothetical protein